jgi:hypothetical protein
MRDGGGEDSWAAVMWVFFFFFGELLPNMGSLHFLDLLTTPPWVGRACKYTLCNFFFSVFETNDNGKSFHLYFSILETRTKRGNCLCNFCCFFSPQAGFPHHLPPAQAHLTGTPDWRVLNNRPFPPSQYFHHHPHFATHNVLAAIDRMERPFLDGSECR